MFIIITIIISIIIIHIILFLFILWLYSVWFVDLFDLFIYVELIVFCCLYVSIYILCIHNMCIYVYNHETKRRDSTHDPICSRQKFMAAISHLVCRSELASGRLKDSARGETRKCLPHLHQIMGRHSAWGPRKGAAVCPRHGGKSACQANEGQRGHLGMGVECKASSGCHW